MFSSRVPDELAPNRLARAVAAAHAAGRALVDLTASNPTRAGIAYPPDLLRPLAHRRGLLYEPHPLGQLAARNAVAADYRRRGLEIAPDRIVLTSSTSEAYSLLFKLLADAGDEVLIPRPSYPLLDHLTRLDALSGQPYDLEYHGGWSIDVASVARAMSARTRALVLVSPNNPTGSLVRRHELDALAALCGDRNVAILADEVFVDYELRAGAAGMHARPLTCKEALVFSLGGLSKSIGLPQAKVGWIAAGGPPPLVTSALERLELVCDTYLSVSTPAQMALPELLDAGTSVRRQIQERVRANYRGLIAWVPRDSGCRVLEADAGWYAVLQVPTFEPEEDLVVSLVEREGVLAHPGYFFDFARGSHLIVSLLPPPSIVEDGVRRILRHFDCRTSTHE